MPDDERSDVNDPDAATSSPTHTPTAAERAAICPFVRTVLVQHPDLYDDAGRTMSLESLLELVRNQRADRTADPKSLEQVFSFFARVNHTPFPLWLRNLVRRGDRFSTDFPGSRGDHPGSTGIYREADGEFDAAAFERVVSHSTDGSTMSQKDIAAAIIEANDRPENPGSAIDLVNSAGEFALLLNLIGNGDGTMRIADMRTLFAANDWPPGALSNLGRASAAEWRTLTREITRHIIELKHDGPDRERAWQDAEKQIDRIVE